MAEIQQTSDITYRIYDWDRKDLEGNYRDLHTEEAIDAIDYMAKSSYKTSYSKKQNESSQIVSCPYFTTHVIPIKGQMSIDHSKKDSFVIYMCVKGKAIFSNENNHEELSIGQTLLVPAALKHFVINSDVDTELLEVFIQ